MTSSARSAIDAAFVNTFARYDLPHDDANDDRDFDKASFGIVKVLGGGRTGTAYPGLPWEPKAAFHALADYGRTGSRKVLTVGEGTGGVGCNSDNASVGAFASGTRADRGTDAIKEDGGPRDRADQDHPG